MIDNLRQFIEAFNDRNLFDDDALKNPAEKARLVVTTVFDGLVTERKRRKFNFEQQSRPPIGALRRVGLVLENVCWWPPNDPILRVNC